MNDISVIIPTWNRARQISNAVRSALAQTVPPLEVLVCDDGSDDETRDVVHALKDPRVRWIEGPHAGLPAVPRNRGIAEARGSWLAFLDSDDEWLPGKLELQLHVAETLGVKAVSSNAYRVAPQNVGLVVNYGRQTIRFADLIHENVVICSSAMVKKEILDKTGGFPENPALLALEDYALWLRVAMFTNIGFLDTPLLNYFDDPDNSVRKESLSVQEQRKRIFDDTLCWGRNKEDISTFMKKIRRHSALERLQGIARQILKRGGLPGDASP